jgi:hypothetical protein
VALSPFWVAYIDLISAYGWKGMQAEARAAMAELDKLMPGYTVKKWASADWSDSPTFKAEYASSRGCAGWDCARSSSPNRTHLLPHGSRDSPGTLRLPIAAPPDTHSDHRLVNRPQGDSEDKGVSTDPDPDFERRARRTSANRASCA